jgi:predicted flap endonuclease-1-like 5' DNA nuclease
VSPERGAPSPGPGTDLPSIGSPARDALALAGVTRLEQLPAWSEKELLALHGVGPKAVRILRDALAERGLRFRA